MRRVWSALAVCGIVALVAAPVAAGKRHHHKHKPAGVKGVVLNSTCPGACAEPPPPPPLYTGTVTIDVRPCQRRGAGGEPGDRRRALQDPGRSGAATTSARSPRAHRRVSRRRRRSARCQAQGAAIIAPCLTGETKRVQVRPHRMHLRRAPRAERLHRLSSREARPAGFEPAASRLRRATLYPAELRARGAKLKRFDVMRGGEHMFCPGIDPSLDT